MNPKRPIVACPTCGKTVEWVPESEWRPFCSERCKIIDLGAWAAEKYRVPVVEDKDELESGEPGEPPLASTGSRRNRT
jgi:endogenous inhibitor of DNA gyrase (YacG/DUF329 family)